MSAKIVNSIAILALLLFIIYVGAILWIWNERPTKPGYPKEDQLRGVFKAQHAVFEQLRLMAAMDSARTHRIAEADLQSSGLNTDRRRSYGQLLSMIQPDLTLWIDDHEIIKFEFESGGSSLAVGAEWTNGIEYISDNVERYGCIVKCRKDIDLQKEEIYLIPIEGHWFIYHEQWN